MVRLGLELRMGLLCSLWVQAVFGWDYYCRSMIFLKLRTACNAYPSDVSGAVLELVAPGR